MQIDHDERGHARAMLVSVSAAAEAGPDGKYFTIFIPIAEILKLRHTEQTLHGHPWLDVPPEEIIGLNISRADSSPHQSVCGAGTLCRGASGGQARRWRVAGLPPG